VNDTGEPLSWVATVRERQDRNLYRARRTRGVDREVGRRPRVRLDGGVVTPNSRSRGRPECSIGSTKLLALVVALVAGTLGVFVGEHRAGRTFEHGRGHVVLDGSAPFVVMARRLALVNMAQFLRGLRR